MKYIDNFNHKSSARISLVYHYNVINSSGPTDVSVRKLSFLKKKYSKFHLEMIFENNVQKMVSIMSRPLYVEFWKIE